MDTLCEEILLNIFSFLDGKSRLVGEMVCRKWNCILNDSTLKMWNVKIEWDRTQDTLATFLEACKRGTMLGVKYMASKIVNEATNCKSFPGKMHDVWSQGFLAAAQNNRPEIIYLMSSYGVIENHDEVLREARRLNHRAAIQALLELAPEEDRTKSGRSIDLEIWRSGDLKI